MHNRELSDQTNTYGAEAIRSWLKEVVSITGLRPTPLAKAAGLAPSTLLRALDPEHPGSLERRSIEKIVEKFKVAPPGMYNEPQSRQPRFAEDELDHFDLRESLVPLEADETPLRLKARSLDLAGYLPGDIVIANQKIIPRPRDVVIASVIDQRSGKTETVLRVYDPPYLLTESSDPSARHKPLLVDNDRISIWATVVRAVRLRK